MRRLYQRKLCRLLTLLLIVAGMAHHARAQSTVTGVVTSNDGGGGLPGVSVVVKGSTDGTITDVDGKFSIAVPSKEAVLVFTYIGHITEEMIVGEQSVINLAMTPDILTLNEVVVVGYGTQEKVNLTGAVSAVKIDEKMTSRALTNVSSALSGLVPGLTAVQGTGMAGRNDATLLIRGLGTVNNASPLIVVDGMPDVDINRINMNDIESISVLKDAASAAVYGSRGANGVIVITTKSGKGQEKTRINYTGSYAIQKATKAYDYMTDYPRSLTLSQRQAASTSLQAGYKYQNGTIDQWMAMDMIDPFRYPSTDWWDIILRDGTVANHNISATGSNDKSNFFISAGLMDQKGLQINNDFTRYNVRFNYDYNVRDNISVGVKFNGNWSKFQYALEDGFIDDEGNNFDLQYAIAGITPYDPVTGYYGGVMAYNEDTQAYNPYTVYQNNLTNQNRQEVNPNLYFEWKPLKGLTARIDYALNYYNQFRSSAPIPNRSYNFQLNAFGPRIYVGDNAGITNVTDTGYKTQLNGRLGYDFKLGDNHEITTLFVYSEEYWYNRLQTSGRTDRLHPSLTEVDAALPGTQTSAGGSNEEGLRSYIGRISYAGFGRYLVEGSFRYDGSSKFLDGSRYGFFPSVAVGWRFTEENFLSGIGWLASGKLRASYGSLGNNSGVGRYEQQETFAAGLYWADGNIAKGFEYRKMVNPDLSWETSKVLNIGLDLGFYNNRLIAEIDYYDRLTEGMLRPSQMSNLLTGAYDAPRMNIGNLRNRGIEGNFIWREKTGNITYTIGINASYNATRLESWNEYIGRGSTVTFSGLTYNVFLDMPYNFSYGYADRGLAQTWEDVYSATPQGASPGDILREDLNGDGRIDANDKKAYPHAQRDRPTTNFGVNGSFAYKGFDLAVLVQGSAGRKDHWLNNYNNVNFSNGRYASTTDHWSKPWSLENRGGEWPRIGGGAGNREETQFWLDDMSYVRIKNLQLGYTVPSGILSRVGASSMRIFASTENLATFTKYRGLDPEKTGNRSDAYPLTKSYSLGINIGI